MGRSRQHALDRSKFVVRWRNPGRILASFYRLQGLQKQPASRDDRAVRCAQALQRAVSDVAHTLLDRTVLRVEALDPRVVLGPLHLTIAMMRSHSSTVVSPMPPRTETPGVVHQDIELPKAALCGSDGLPPIGLLRHVKMPVGCLEAFRAELVLQRPARFVKNIAEYDRRSFLAEKPRFGCALISAPPLMRATLPSSLPTTYLLAESR